jgi:hypothetical protein
LSGFLIDLFVEEWSGSRSSAIFRNCRSFKSLRQEYVYHFRQAYGMSYPSFRQLLHIIEDDIRPKKRFWGQNGTIQQLQGDFVRGARLASLIAGAALMAGVLICMEKPSEKDCKEAGVDSRKFFCARQHQYGLNMQAVCDADRRCFLDVSIRNLAATSDYLSFATSELNHSNLRRDRFLVDGIALYGDAAYVNCEYMVSPFQDYFQRCVFGSQNTGGT